MPTHILVVEDEVKWHEQYKDILDEEWKVDVAEDFQKASALLESSTYHLVLLDLSLDQPEFNLVCQRFLSLLAKKYPDLPVIAITGKPLNLQELDMIFLLGEGSIIDFVHKDKINILDFRRRIQLAEKKYPLSKKNSTELVYDAFISYSHQDKEWVREWLLPKLEAAGLRICIDFRDFKIGAANVNEMARAVVRSRKTLLILTSSYLDSHWAEYEFILAQTIRSVSGERRLIPLFLKPCELPITLSAFVYLDFTMTEKANLQIPRLIEAIKS